MSILYSIYPIAAFPLMSLVVREAGTRWKSPLIMRHCSPRVSPIKRADSVARMCLKKKPHILAGSRTHSIPDGKTAQARCSTLHGFSMII